MNSKDQLYDEVFKIVLIGDSGVGKTNLLAYDPKEVVKGEFVDRYKPTVGVEFSSKIVVADDGRRIKAQIWDTAGQERYRAITSSHYRRSAGAMLVYDVTSPESLQRANEVWLGELLKSADDEAIMKQCITLVGNKSDLDPAVSVDAHRIALEEMGLVLNARTSAKTGENVEQAFEELIKRVYELQKGKVGRRSTTGPQIKRSDSSKSGSCCR
uniref:Uncharacterized protein n=1 Tax=Octactis speculum TaxID=3111310 RepID=A0A7S2DF35_9STRA|mmetsp:Transcript_48089/g.65480  ORF Transcript_48089/g.65480 Transcript_48089/m.65480 type:complete len:213 (+) Transcript_48089:78-716(+)|eukprot:CAMPEP_0185771672 /NCGR_PEP_ID=MMETSP1174-20130828/64561_1 /TAXON_ID=35687 /ORGANISM="Dictyocha speculum, Strain CCMP1381" /LENGTH=212 /DNA_ID=CAMNT_0028457593 /DNA_START=78 /DNA_END=716 /DNA_ORIENTATION=+